MSKLKKNYLNNRDLLAEVHKSKVSYSYFIDDAYADYDLIVSDINNITQEEIEKAISNRVDKINRKRKEAEGKNAVLITPDQIDEYSLVYRMMTSEHIPAYAMVSRRSKKNITEKPVTMKFNPFKHYIRTPDDEIKEVGRSHWTGGLENGYFETEHGRLTDELAKMFVMLVERFSQKSNFRGYSWILDLRSAALLQLVNTALKFDESKSDNVFGYFTNICYNTFIGYLNTEKKIATVKSKIMVENGYDANFSNQTDHDLGDDY